MSSETKTAAPEMIITAAGAGGHHYDDAWLRATHLDDSDAGRYVVICGRERAVGVGDTAEAALADASRCCGEQVVESDDEEYRCEVVEIVGMPAAEVRARLQAAIDESRHTTSIVHVSVADIDRATEILADLAADQGGEMDYTDRERGAREAWGWDEDTDADQSAWRLELTQD